MFFPTVMSDDPLEGLHRVTSHAQLFSAGYYYFGDYQGDGYMMMLLDFRRRLPDGDMPVVWVDHEVLVHLGNENCGDRAAVEAVVTELRPSLRALVRDVVAQFPDPNAPEPFPGKLWQIFLLGRGTPSREAIEALVVELIAGRVLAPPCALLSSSERWWKTKDPFQIASLLSGRMLGFYDHERTLERLGQAVVYRGSSSAELRAALREVPCPPGHPTVTLWFDGFSRDNPGLQARLGAWIAPQVVIQVFESPSYFSVFDTTKPYEECTTEFKFDVGWYVAVVGRSREDQTMLSEIDQAVARHVSRGRRLAVGRLS